MKHAISSVLFALPLALIACGGDDGGVTLIDGGDIDADNSGPDACVSKPSAPGKLKGAGRFTIDDGGIEHGACQATATYGDATIGQAAAGGQLTDACVATSPPDFINYQGTLNADATPDVLDIELYNGFGVYGNGIATGSVTIAGDEAQYATCGACVLLYADVDAQGMPGSLYMATSGTINVTSIAPNVTGTLANIVWTHVDIDPSTFMSTPNADACMSGVTSVAFDAPIEF